MLFRSYKDDVKDERGHQSRPNLGENELEHDVSTASAIHQTSLIKLRRDAIDKPFQNPDRKGNREHRVEDDQTYKGIFELENVKKLEEGNNECCGWYETC